MTVQRLQDNAVDSDSLLESMQSDKTALSRAIAQNKELKVQLAELQNGFVKMVCTLNSTGYSFLTWSQKGTTKNELENLPVSHEKILAALIVPHVLLISQEHVLIYVIQCPSMKITVYLFLT